ncbi:ABC transporter permease [Jatrophihabitans telluris]|uniref:Transport permease protein n=1 Tax=Jatrophihabitans telluris TaxID=2038343 RepID=A0ABY4QXJ9_9ACTN|nr:ABC transporter permease [Jatrophihabitans telluris]UQX87556.1 ABC transporter permease [Jatrophihabitans telluris]
MSITAVNRRPTLFRGVAEVFSARELLFNLTSREVRGKYKRTALGQLWSLLNPLAQMLTYSLVFGFFLPARNSPGDPSGLDVFALWLSAALLPWILFSGVLTGSMGSLLANENLLKKVYFVRSSLVISTALATLFTSLFEFGVLIVAIYLFGGNPTLYIPFVVLFMILLTALALGLGFLLAVANVYFRDTQHFVAIFLQVLFYLTPIVYPVSQVADRVQKSHPWVLTAFRLNPMERFSEAFRNLLYDNRLPSLPTTLYCIVVPLAVLAVGFSVFIRFEGRLAEEL